MGQQHTFTGGALRIALIIDGLKTGGAELQAALSARELARRGHTVYLVSYHEGNDYEELLADSGARRVLIPARGFFRLKRVRRIARFLKQKDIEVAHCFKKTSSVWGRMAAKRAGVPCIYGGWRGLTPAGRLANWLNRLLSRNTAGWIVNSSSIKSFLCAELGLAAESVRVVHNGLDPQRLHARTDGRQLRSWLGLGDFRRVVSVFANLRPVKNHAMIVRAAEKVSGALSAEVAFLFAGEGPLRAPLEEQIRRAGLEGSVLLLGHRRDVADILGITDVVALGSYSEGLPNCLLEAAAAGVPAVSTNNGGAADVIVHGKTGYLVDCDDDEAMAAALVKLLADEDLRRSIGRAAHQKCEAEFSLEAMGDRLLAAYREGLVQTMVGKEVESA